MTKEENYIRYKKQGLIDHLNLHTYRYLGDRIYDMAPESFDIGKELCGFSMCQNCGMCCNAFPCTFSPCDFLDINDMGYMRSILDTGLICISQMCWSDILVLRPRGVGDEGIVSLKWQIVFDESGNNSCLLNQKGCLLNPEYRPTEGLLYTPLESGDHVVKCTESQLAREYFPYQDAIGALADEYYFTKEVCDASKENVQRLSRRMAGYKR